MVRFHRDGIPLRALIPFDDLWKVLCMHGRRKMDLISFTASPIFFRLNLQPNIRRTFPGPSRSSSEDDDEAHLNHPPVYRAGGKQFGKALRPAEDDDDDDDDSEEESEEESPVAQQQFAVRGSGKQLAGSGKYLRP